MKNKLLKSFLSDKEANMLYKNYLLYPTEEKKQVIENKFKLHSKKIQILTYFSKVLFFEAQHFDKKIRANSNINQLIINGDNVNEDANFLDSLDNVIHSFENSIEIEIAPDELENFFEDKQLYQIISQLSAKNKELLYLLYVKEISEVEVAKRLGITIQAVNKRKNKLLSKIRENYTLFS